MSVLICIDPGHGGKDSGAGGFGIYEKNVVLALAKKVSAELSKYDGVSVMFTRTDDRFIELSQRANLANAKGADYFISLHNNSAPSAEAHGFESYIYTKPSKASIDRQNIMHSHVMKYLSKYGIFDRGKKRANFAVVRETKMPAILLENLFISNPKENKLLKDDAFLNGLAQAIAEGVADIFNLKRKAAPQPAQPKPAQPKPQPVQPAQPAKLYRVQVGAFKDKENAERLAEQLKKAGYPAVIDYR